MIDRENVFDQPSKSSSYIESYESIRKITIDQGDDYTFGCLHDYLISKKTLT